MGGDWRLMTLREAGISLIDCVHKTPEAIDKGFPYIAIPQMKEGRLEPESARQISEEDLKLWTKKADPKPFDVVLSRRCNPGETAHVPQGMKFALGQNLVLLRADGDSVVPEFLRWLVRGPEWWDQIRTYMNVGAVFTSLKCADVPNFEVTIPPKEAQRTISQTLSALDDKIEVNRTINRTLEAMAQAIFKSWFVDFDPVKAKMAARESGADPTRAAMAVISGKNDTELDAFQQQDPKSYERLRDTAEAFPDALVDSELGMIPHGWGVGTVRDVTTNIFSGGTPNTKEPAYWGGAEPWFSSGETRNRLIVTTEKTITKEGVKHSSTRLACPGDILIASAGQGHTRGQTSMCQIDTYINQSVVAIRADETKCSSSWLFQNLSNRYEEMRGLSDSHSSRGSLTTKLLAGMPIILPCKTALVAYAVLADALFLRGAENERESSTLGLIRDALLPRLLSGVRTTLDPNPEGGQG